jgi:hypothetical protein
VRIYPGLWENAPAGAVEPPSAPGLWGAEHLARTLAKEEHEEVGWDLGPGGFRPIALVEDPRARSVDVVLRRDLAASPTPPCRRDHRGEYADLRWVPVHTLPPWLGTSSGIASPPTLALLRFLGWLGGKG